MKILLTGGTGALGRRAVHLLVVAGHEVTALARTPQKAELIRALGGDAVQFDLFDADAVAAAAVGHEVVLNLATSIPPIVAALKPSSWDTNNRIRTEGAANLEAAARAAGAARYIQESITFTYPDRGAEWIDETVALEVSPFTASVQAAEASVARFTEHGGTGVVLRFAMFYGTGSTHTETFLKAARKHISPVAGSPGAYLSSIHLHDAATAVVASLAVPAGVYNVGDDEPVTRREFGRAIGAGLGKRPWITSPGRLARLAGKQSSTMRKSQRVSNGKFREAARWAPTYPSVREGWATVGAGRDIEPIGASTNG